MDALTGYFPHQSVPVETDERMTFSSVELARPPPVQLHQGRTEALSRLQDRGGDVNAVWRLPEAPEWHFTKTHPGQMNSPHTALARPPGHPELALRSLPDPVACYSLRSAGPSNWPEECSGSLEPPLPLLSDVNSNHNGPARHPAASRPGQCSRPEHRRHVGHLPLNPLPHRCSCHDKQNYPVNVRHTPGAYRPSWNFPQKKLPSSEAAGSWCGRPPHDVVHEVSINPPLQKEPAWETRRTISLPEECRNIFITYSVDVAREMPSFTTFLADHGFKPAIDIFDNPLRRLDTTKWMDRYLNDESVLIIVAISPKYKEDVAGVGNDEHGLHTKYIHNQLQNEFIQQGSLNFRLVPVLFPPATKDHVPRWLRSTSIYRWNLVSTQDTQDLLLRLLREERYVIPKPRSSLTLTVRPV